MSDNIFTGCIPALMTPCTHERAPDFDALVAKGRELIDIGMSAVVYWVTGRCSPRPSARKVWRAWWLPVCRPLSARVR